jgi:hypothetical protein
MKLTPIVDDGFEDDTAPSTPYVSRQCAVTGRVWRAVLAFTRWTGLQLRTLRLTIGSR